MVPHRASRMSADERRAIVIEAAITEISEHGYHAASTSAIAHRAEISQPYLYALFPSKKDVFLAAYKQVGDELRDTFAKAAARGSDSADTLRRMGEAYRSLLGDRRLLTFQLQAYAASGDPDIRAAVSAGLTHWLEAIEHATGARRADVIRFSAMGMFLTIAGALDLPEEWRPGSGP
jgi:AcrR family transcriptional regulator